MHEFGLRHYDATLGRWGVQDPFMQYYNPYLAMGNNPVSIIDPTGGTGFSSQGNPKRATYDDPEYYRGGGGGRGIATVGGPMGWDGIGGDMYTTNATGGRDFDEDKYSEYIALITGTSGMYGIGADGQSNYGYFSSYYKAMEIVKSKSGAKIEYNNYTKTWGYRIRRIINEVSADGSVYHEYSERFRDLGISYGGGETIVDNTEQALGHYLFGDGSAVNIGINSVNSLLKSDEFINSHEGIIHNPAVTTGSFPVDMTRRVFHIGDTRVSWIADFDNQTVTYKLFDGDGFWDPDIIDEYFLGDQPYFRPDGPGPNLERLGGTPYYYNPLIITLPF